MANAENPLKQLEHFGQAVWLDYIRRHLLTSAEFRRMLDEDGLKGMTSNPTIFEKAIAGSTDYDDQLKELAPTEKSIDEIYEALSMQDIKMAADAFRPLYDKSGGIHGYISYEVSPTLANDTDGTIAAARRYWDTLARPNVMIKVPSTPAGLPAIEQLISEGLNVNVTLMFSMKHYDSVAEAFIRGLERRLKAGQIDRQGLVGRERIRQPRRDSGRSQARGQIESVAERGGRGADGQIGGRELAAHLPALQGNFRGRPIQGRARERRSSAMAAMGIHRHQKSRIQRRQVRRGTRRPRHRQHDAAGDDGCVPRPRQAARVARGGRRGGARHRQTAGGGWNRSHRGRRGVAERGRRVVCAVVRGFERGHQGPARGNRRWRARQADRSRRPVTNRRSARRTRISTRTNFPRGCGRRMPRSGRRNPRSRRQSRPGSAS